MSAEDYIELIELPPEYEDGVYTLVKVEHETEKALYVRCERDRDHDILFWVPKSRSRIEDDVKWGKLLFVDGWIDDRLDIKVEESNK